MLAPFPSGRTVIVRTAVPNGRDAFGNAEHSFTTTTYTGCAVLDGSSTEDDAGRTTITNIKAVLLPPGSAVTALDEVQLDDGSIWAVDGQPAQPRSQMTGSTGGVWVNLRRVTG